MRKLLIILLVIYVFGLAVNISMGGTLKDYLLWPLHRLGFLAPDKVVAGVPAGMEWGTAIDGKTRVLMPIGAVS